VRVFANLHTPALTRNFDMMRNSLFRDLSDIVGPGALSVDTDAVSPAVESISACLRTCSLHQYTPPPRHCVLARTEVGPFRGGTHVQL